MMRALFLDRDGVINQEVGYLYRPAEVRWVEGIFPLARTARSLGYRLVVVTNQSGIARGLYSTAEFEALMDWMRARFEAEGAPLDAVYHCPYHPEHGKGEWKREHPDRKPGAGMLLRAASEFGIALRASVLVGDRCSDLGAARAADLRQAFLLRGTEPGACSEPHISVNSLQHVADWLRDAGEETERTESPA